MPIPITCRGRSTASRRRGCAKDKGHARDRAEESFRPDGRARVLARKAVPGHRGVRRHRPQPARRRHERARRRTHGAGERRLGPHGVDVDVRLREPGAGEQVEPPFVRVSENGALLPETKAVIAAIAKHSLVLASGHVSAQEALMMFEEGRRVGVRAMVATHGMSAPTSLTVEQARQATRSAPSSSSQAARWRRQTRRPGSIASPATSRGRCRSRHRLVRSRAGEATELPADGYATYMEALRQKGFTDQELDRMVKGKSGAAAWSSSRSSSMRRLASPSPSFMLLAADRSTHAQTPSSPPIRRYFCTPRLVPELSTYAVQRRRRGR